ncbi:MAG: Clp protease N-terminal domain-containing protein [Planctomycetota bacterium]|jgi:ATP-dependent Clp protease ATP-binding subunit ClpC
MLPKSSQRVAKVIKLANEIAHEYDLEYVGTEHLLLAIQREGSGVGSTILTNRGITESRLKDQVDQLVKSQLEETWVFGRLPGTPHFKNVMATAIEQCRQLEAKEVCTEHVLLALIKEKGSVAQKALRALGLSYETARTDVLGMTSA